MTIYLFMQSLLSVRKALVFETAPINSSFLFIYSRKKNLTVYSSRTSCGSDS